MQIPQPRTGNRLEVSRKAVPFGLWPTRVGPTGNHSLQPLLFSLDPWAIIELAIEERCLKDNKPEAFASLEQSRDFYESATQSKRIAARPLTLYYCLMNLVKAFCLTRNTRSTFNKAQHGLSEQLDPIPGAKELVNAFLDAYPSPNAKGEPQNFSEFQNALVGHQIPAKISLRLSEVLPQIVPGHRLWSQASGRKERFIAIHDIHFCNDPATKTMWLRLFFVAEDLHRLKLPYNELLSTTGLSGNFEQVQCVEKLGDRNIICFEQTTPATYTTNKPANELSQIINPVKNLLWSTVSAIPPYRRYYVYTCPATEQAGLLPQLLSIYAVSYYLGSITRYRPHHFENLLRGPFGPRIQDFVTGQPLQFLYLMASEFSKQDIAKPSIL